MSADKKLVQSLISRDEETEKLASKSVEELEVMFKKANGDMLQYFKDHPEKLEEKKERDSKKEKKASPFEMADAWGRELAKTAEEKKPSAIGDTVRGAAKGGLVSGAVGGTAGAVLGHEVGKRFVEHRDIAPRLAKQVNPKAAKGVLKGTIAAATGLHTAGKAMKYGIPAGAAIGLTGHLLKKSKEKKAEKDTERADRYGKNGAKIWGGLSGLVSLGQLAQGHGSINGAALNTALGSAVGYGAGRLTHRVAHGKATGKEVSKSASVEKVALSFNRINEASKLVGRVGRLVEKHGPAVKEMAGKAGKTVHEGVRNVGNRMSNIKDPIVKGMATGGAIGGVGGAAQGFLDPKENPYTGEKQRLRSAFRKGMAGAAGGMVSGALVGSMNGGSTKTAAMPGLGNIGSMAKNFVGSMKPVAQKAMASAAPHVAKGMNAIHGSSMGKSVGMGAAGGAALGAAKGLVAPGTDANGKPKGRIGAMVGGAAKGGLMGAGAGAAAKAGVTHMATKAGIPAAPKLLSA